MKSTLISILAGSAALCSAGAFFASAQQPLPQGYTTVIPLQSEPQTGSIQSLITNNPLPLWNYSVTASSGLGSGTYSGTIMGRSPYNHGKTTTTIPTQIIPLIITINNGGGDTQTYDPTATDACVTTGSHTDVDVITGSPIFTNNTWTMNGVNVGNTQYIDAFQRAEFWSLVGGSGYHLILKPQVLAPQTLTFGSVSGSSGAGTNYDAVATFRGCGFIGVVTNAALDNAVKALITGPLAGTVNTATFPVFLIKSVVSTNSGVDIFSQCCILGYHSAFTVGANVQVYSPFSLDYTGTFGNSDVSTLAHEMGEAVNDPLGNNPTPVWGNIGQVSGACQNNFEVGDPLTPGHSTPTNEFSLVGANGLTYHSQELAYFSWFYGGTSLGTGGKYSNNGTFGGSAKLCSAGGGTN